MASLIEDMGDVWEALWWYGDMSEWELADFLLWAVSDVQFILDFLDLHGTVGWYYDWKYLEYVWYAL